MTKQKILMAPAIDPVNFIKNHRIGYNSQTKEIGLLPLLEFEHGNLNAMNLNQNSIFVKSRQMHFSSLVSAYAAWFISTQNKKNVLVVCPSSAQAKEFLNKTRVVLQHYFGDNSHDNMPINSAMNIELKNGSNIRVTGSNISACKLQEMDLIIFDEAAYSDFEDIWTSAEITLASREGKCIVYSSVNYENDFFLKTYYDAKLKKNNFMPVKRLWNENPYNDLSYYENMVLRIGLETAKQELDCVPRTKEKKINRNNVITFRVDEWMEKEINKKLLQKSEELKDTYTISTYLRELILKDLK